MTIYIHGTKKGLPALWEWGGGYSTPERRSLLPDRKERRKSRFIFGGADVLPVRSTHYLFVEVGDLVIQSFHHREDFVHKIYQITAIREDEADLKQLAEYSKASGMRAIWGRNLS